jgi:protein-L-isoaspartate(D-aspartate) O-methyltransferase
VPGQTEATLRAKLVEQLSIAGWIRTDAVASAFASVARHLFLPGVDPAVAYADEAVVTRTGADGRPLSSSSQPAVMAAMLEQLAVARGHHVLEVGAGTGYNAALLARLVGDRGAVTSIDIDLDLVERARRHLTAAGLPDVTVVCADGADGWRENAPYDRIIVTAGASDLSPVWTEQLAEGGRLVLPLSLRGVQQSVAFDPAADHLMSVSVIDCGFMPLRGALAGRDPIRPLGEHPGLFLRLERDRAVDTLAIDNALTHPGDVLPIGVRVTPQEAMRGLALWLALQEPDVGQLAAVGAAADHARVPALIAIPGMTSTMVLVGRSELAALVPHDATGAETSAVAVRAYGPGADGLAERLAAHVRQWDAHGRPSTSALHIRAYPHGAAASHAAITIDMPHTRFLVDWHQGDRTGS